jgi:hypothetical protein
MAACASDGAPCCSPSPMQTLEDHRFSCTDAQQPQIRRLVTIHAGFGSRLVNSRRAGQRWQARTGAEIELCGERVRVLVEQRVRGAQMSSRYRKAGGAGLDLDMRGQSPMCGPRRDDDHDSGGAGVERIGRDDHAGRRPERSRPTGSPKSTSQTSPRRALTRSGRRSGLSQPHVQMVVLTSLVDL